jgi:hypothetical protein
MEPSSAGRTMTGGVSLVVDVDDAVITGVGISGLGVVVAHRLLRPHFSETIEVKNVSVLPLTLKRAGRSTARRNEAMLNAIRVGVWIDGAVRQRCR